MFNNLTIEKAQFLQQKMQEIKNTLDLDLFTHTSQEVSITVSVLGNIKEIQNPQNKSVSELISFINEATTKARQEYEVKQAQLLQKEMMHFM
jgi:hypothetical protein